MRESATRRRWLAGGPLLAALATVCLASAGAAPAPPAVSPAPAPGSREAGFWQRAKVEEYKSPQELAAQQARYVRKAMRVPLVMRGDPREKTVALTFDDGPHAKYTPQLLAILRRYKVKGTFFVVGEMAARYPNLVRAEIAEGHQLGNHTYHHVNLTKIPVAEVQTEFRACQDVIKGITGHTMRYDRPPGGDWDMDVVQAAQQVGLTTVLWTDDPGDYANPGDGKIENRVLDRVANGGIILLHDGVQQTLEVLPQILERLQRRGYRFVTVDELRPEETGTPPRTS